MRAVAMRLRVLRRFDWLGGGGADRAVLDACITAALLRRQACIADEEDARFLHPARTALILMDDAEVRSAAVLGAAALVDSVDSSLAVEPSVLAGLPPGAVRIAAEVPRPRDAGERLAEELLGADAEVRLIAVAERLDQARHAHMLPSFDEGAWLAETRALYGPLARRTHPRLALRYERWLGARERRGRSG